jgi:hypothetical protein
VQVQVEHAVTPVKTTDAGTVTEWEHFDYGYHSGTETLQLPHFNFDCECILYRKSWLQSPCFFSHSLAGERRGHQRDSEGLQGKKFLKRETNFTFTTINICSSPVFLP